MVYGDLFEPRRHQPVKLLEVGIDRGASLSMWQDYFQGGKIFGIDAETARLTTTATVLEADQADASKIVPFCDEHGPFDIIIDDASHIGGKTIATFEILLPYLAPGGMYCVEDLAGESRSCPGFVVRYAPILKDIAFGLTRRWERVVVAPELMVFVKARNAVCE